MFLGGSPVSINLFKISMNLIVNHDDGVNAKFHVGRRVKISTLKYQGKIGLLDIVYNITVVLILLQPLFLQVLFLFQTIEVVGILSLMGQVVVMFNCVLN